MIQSWFVIVATTRADISGKRLRALGEAALGLFCRVGYERCQVADVAKAMGVAVGTVYLYVESKEALFDLVIRHAAREDDRWLDGLDIPVKTPPPGTTLEVLRAAFEQCAEWPALTAALAADHAEDALAELRAVLAEQYGLTFRYRRPLLLLTKCALEFPGLADVFVAGLRDRLLDLLAGYLSRRAQAGLLRTVPDFRAAAALMVQAIAWSTLQRPHDPGMTALSDEVAETATLDLLVQGMRPLS